MTRQLPPISRKRLPAILESERSAFGRELINHLQVLAIKYPNVGKLETVAFLGRTIGQLIKKAPEQERELVRDVALRNIDE